MTRGIRIAALACLWLVPTLLLSTSLLSDWTFVWERVHVPSYTPPFLDLRSITSGLKTVQHGGDPLIANPRDPLRRTMNYPRIWLHLFAWMGINDSNLWMVGIAFCGLYLVGVSWLILQTQRALDAVILLVAGLSLSALFAIERGNSDLLIFSLVLLGCVSKNKYFKLAAFFTAAVLKIFPIATLLADILRRPLRKSAAGIAFLAAAFALFAWEWRDLRAIKASTPVSTTLSFGLPVLLAQAHYLSPIQVALGLFAMVIILTAAWLARPAIEQSALESTSGGMFVIFGCVYLFSFVIASNWDYRLIFLLPTLPFVLDSARDRRSKTWAIVYVGALLLAANSFFAGVYQGIPAIDLASVILLMLLLTVLFPALWKSAWKRESFPSEPAI
ncbi:MAG TPA: hypothetical protein VMR90_01525 [Candidatus Cybelea sp.]|nr:hypothetical protein [Candidatus Cybelea sp.]